MSEMIEQVARAMCKDAGYNTDDYRGTHPIWMNFWHVATVAISAMREPTTAMIIEANNSVSEDALDAAHASDWGFLWRAMIDAALSE